MKDMWTLSESQVVQMTNDSRRREFLETYKDWFVQDCFSTTCESLYSIQFLDKGLLYGVECERIGEPEFDYPSKTHVDYYFIPYKNGKLGNGNTFRQYHISEHAIVQMLKDARKEILEGRK